MPKTNLIYAGRVCLEKSLLCFRKQLWAASNSQDDGLSPTAMLNADVDGRFKVCRQQCLCYQTITSYTDIHHQIKPSIPRIQKNVFNYSYIYSAIMSKQQETGKQSKTTGLWGSTFIFRWTRIAYVNMDKNQHSAGTFHLKIQQNLLSKVIWRSSLITFLIPLPNSMRTIKRHNTSSISTHYRTSTPYSTICSWPRPTCMTSVTSHFPTQFCWI